LGVSKLPIQNILKRYSLNAIRIIERVNGVILTYKALLGEMMAMTSEFFKLPLQEKQKYITYKINIEY
jgi:hypothetical protein